MGEVYRARDTRLDREVAIKVLPVHLAERPELQQRFDREARAVSSLSHPHICPLYDIGSQDGIDFLVMECLEGETLAERLEKGRIPTDDVLRWGAQIAEALETAHRGGVVHRDLKPGNVMITKGGVKVLDFGLAKTAEQAREPAEEVSRTIRSPRTPLTEEGTILGTFQYMAPEQLEGQEADARTDIFALGTILYEMATGHRAFEGKSQASLIAAILEREPAPISTVEPLAPPALGRVVKACLAKNPDDRIQTAHDVALQLQWIAEGGSEVGVPRPVSVRRRRRERLVWAWAGLATMAAVAAGALAVLGSRTEPPAVLRFEIPVPAALVSVDSPRISPDGRYLAFDGVDSTGVSQVWIRRLDSLEAHALPGSEGVNRRPFWSPDSRYVAFFVTGGKLKKVDIAGGPAVTLCEAPTGADGTWSPKGVIIFDGSQGDTLRSVPAAGGLVTAVSTLDRSRGETGHSWPQFLPDGEHFLFLAGGSSVADNVYKVGKLGTMDTKVLAPGTSQGGYADPGYLVYLRDGTLMAQPFDTKGLALQGEPVPITDELTSGNLGLVQYSTSENGVLVYRATSSSKKRLVWVDRSGTRLSTLGDPGSLWDPALSPDGRHVAVTVGDDAGDLWIYDTDRNIATRFTFSDADDQSPVWSPDGTRVLFASDRENGYNLYTKPANGGGDPVLLQRTGSFAFPVDWNGRLDRIALHVNQPGKSWGAYSIGASPGDSIQGIADTPFTEAQPRFSPDGKWIAYASNESGRYEIYVKPYPTLSGRWQVSTDGGSEPFWRQDGREMYYIDPNRTILAVGVTPGDGSFEVGRPVPLFHAEVTTSTAVRNRYLPAPDGRRFLLVSIQETRALTPVTVVVNWTKGLESP